MLRESRAVLAVAFNFYQIATEMTTKNVSFCVTLLLNPRRFLVCLSYSQFVCRCLALSLTKICLGLLPWVKLIDNFDAEYEYVTNEGTLFTFKTNLDAPRYRLINIDFASPAQNNWKELIPQHDKDVIGELWQHSCDL